MSTRAQIRFATREKGQSFSVKPSAIHAQFYKHHDGYPEGLGVEIAESLLNSGSKHGVKSWEIESLTHVHDDIEFIYYIWQAPEKETYISIFDVWSKECIFVGDPESLIKKYEYNDR
tara:strand:- start:311 stop:661 length:351 start_codon:yes stop_codon:yes gene_type:complete